MHRAMMTLVALVVATPAGAATLVSQFAVANSADLSGLTGAGRNRLGGFGSDLSYDAATNTFYGITDRGPGGGMLPYAPRLQSFALDIDRTSGAMSSSSSSPIVRAACTKARDLNGFSPRTSNSRAISVSR